MRIAAHLPTRNHCLENHDCGQATQLHKILHTSATFGQTSSRTLTIPFRNMLSLGGVMVQALVTRQAAGGSAEASDAFRMVHTTHYTLHPTPYTLHPTPYTLHPTCCVRFLLLGSLGICPFVAVHAPALFFFFITLNPRVE